MVRNGACGIERRCTHCHQWLPEDRSHFGRNLSGRYVPRCRACGISQWQKWRARRVDEPTHLQPLMVDEAQFTLLEQCWPRVAPRLSDELADA